MCFNSTAWFTAKQTETRLQLHTRLIEKQLLFSPADAKESLPIWRQLRLNYALSAASGGHSPATSHLSLMQSQQSARKRIISPEGGRGASVLTPPVEDGQKHWDRQKQTEMDTGQTPLTAVWVPCHWRWCHRALTHALRRIIKFEKFCNVVA